ncbi:MAG: cupin domain-containing protein [Candidatus Angelobacter sp.]
MKKTTLMLLFTVISIMAVLFAYARERKAGQMSVQASDQTAGAPTPLILQQGEGDQLILRAGPLKGVPFLINVDSQFGKSEDFFIFAEALAPKQTIPFHKHENAEEILLFQEAGASVIVGDKRGNAGSNSIVFIPRNTWISATNNSSSAIHLLAVFSRHGFESYMRSISAKPGEPLTPLNQDELTRLRALGHAVYWDTSKGAYPPGVAHP